MLRVIQLLQTIKHPIKPTKRTYQIQYDFKQFTKGYPLIYQKYIVH